MNFSIVTEYPFWLILLCPALGVLASGLLYFRNKSDVFSPLTFRILTLLRFLSVTLISFLLLAPLLKTITRYNEKPLIIFAQDNSGSLLLNKDSSFIKTQYREQLDHLRESLQQKYKVRFFTFGSSVRENTVPDFSEKQTDMAAVFDEISDRFSNTNVGAVIVAGDGLYNKGIDPLYASGRLKYPLYTIALGDTSLQRDVILSHVNYNRVTYLGNNFPLEIAIDANKYAGARSTLTVARGSRTLFTQNIDFTGDHFSKTVRVLLEASESGMQRYKVSLSPQPGELSVTNNSTDLFIEVLDSKQKILILSGAPHPDVSALKQAVEANFNYEVQSVVGEAEPEPFSKYNLVILDQLPSQSHPATAMLSRLAAAKVPVLYVVGSQTSLNAFNALKSGLSIDVQKSSFNESLPSLNNDFGLFTISEPTRRMISEFPPLYSPFGNYKTLTSSSILFFQRIGNVTTRQPLFLFNQGLDIKTGIIAGEGIWKWSLAEYAKTNRHDAFNELVDKMVQYLSVKSEKGNFKVTGKRNFLENEPVEFDAELYNETYELVNDPDVEMVITNAEKKDFPFIFSKTLNAYHLNAGFFPVGNYSYRAAVKVGDKTYRQAGDFTVTPLNVESINTVADYRLLYRMALQHGGKMLLPGNMNELLTLLKNRDDLKTVMYTQKKYIDFVDIFWILMAVFALLGAEWFIRKRAGGY